MPGLKGSFFIAVLAGAALVIGWAVYQRHAQPLPSNDGSLEHLVGNVWVSEQLEPAALPALKAQQFAAVIDLRPDGEVAGQPSSDVMAQAAQQAQLEFKFIPVPHGDIPAAAVSTLQQTLITQPGRVLLYCRSGKRAARTWALAEASRPGGLDATSIKAAVESVGQPVQDLSKDIDARIAGRP